MGVGRESPSLRRAPQVLRPDARPMQLRELSQGLATATYRDRSVVITFDDGYADNLHNAKPLLGAP